MKSMFWVRYAVDTCFSYEGDIESNREKLKQDMHKLIQRQSGVGSWKVVAEDHLEEKKHGEVC